MYSLEGLNTAKEVVEYVVKSMQNKKLGTEEIKMYKRAVRYCDYSELLKESQDYIDMLNNMNKQSECKITYTGNI